MDDYDGPLTIVSISYGDLDATVSTRGNWTPDMIDDALLKLRRQIVAGARQLGMAPIDDVAEVATAEDD